MRDPKVYEPYDEPASVQARVHASAQSVPSKSEMLITTMSEQIEAQAAQVPPEP
jgi:hypothetical protein